MGVLEHHAERPAQIRLLYLLDVDAVVADLALFDVVEAVDEVGYGGLARARGADESHLLPGLGDEGDIPENGLSGLVGEGDILELDIAAPPDISGGAVRLVEVFPRPHTRAPLALDDIAVRVLFGVDEGDIPLVRLGLGAREREDTLGARERHEDAVDLLGHLPYRRAELPRELQEDYERPEVHAPDARHGEQRARDRGDGVVDIAEVAEYGHEDIRVGVRAAGRVAQPVVDGVERLFFGVLVAESLDHAHPLDMLLDITVEQTYRLLLFDEMPAAPAAYYLDEEEHQGDHDHHEQREQRAYDQHCDEDRKHREPVGDEIGHAVGEQLAQGVGVVCVAAHDLAAEAGVEVGDGQLFHDREHLVAYAALYRRRHAHDEPVVAIGHDDREDIQPRHHPDYHREPAHIRAGHPLDYGREVVFYGDEQH